MPKTRPSQPRLPALEAETLDEETRRLVPAGSFNIFRTLAHHPKLLKRWMVFGNHILSKSTLPAREREIVILRTGWRCEARYEFGQHTVIGKREGLTDDEITALTAGAGDHPWSPADRALVDAADELHDDQCVSESTWAAMAERWNDQQLLDIVFTAGQYTLVSMALNTLGVELDDGMPGWPGE